MILLAQRNAGGIEAKLTAKRIMSASSSSLAPTSSLPPPTYLLYFLDSYKFTAHAKLLEVRRVPDVECMQKRSENDKKNNHNTQGRSSFFDLVLDQTIFHPQGGGQPSDEGSISHSSSGLVFDVSKTVLDKETGVVLHRGVYRDSSSSSSPSVDPLDTWRVGDEVLLQINVAKRTLHTKLHTAGHLVDLAESQLGFNWLPGKAFHFPEGPYIEYNTGEHSVKITEANRGEISTKLNNTCNDLINNSNHEGNHSVHDKERRDHCDSSMKREDQEEEIEKEEEVGLESAKDSFLPTAVNTRRYVSIGGVGTFCGGTHLRDIKELQQIQIKKISSKKNLVRIHYTVPA
ncbi:alanine--trna ligase-like [Cystoisospora suis]|uniref:Alanine--trna ligase-like n=1 Tax=Cystoisospora suis TaxID=483139 RepID=A0A2C6KH34_9APIC|nr:alanine--trna ligase-like [Cystoisospora suis]